MVRRTFIGIGFLFVTYLAFLLDLSLAHTAARGLFLSIGGFTFVLGLVFVLWGRKRHGPRHRKHVRWGLIVLGVMLVGYLIITIGISVSVISSFLIQRDEFRAGTRAAIDLRPMAPVLALSYWARIVGTAGTGVAVLLFTRSFETGMGTRAMLLGVALAIGCSVFVAMSAQHAAVEVVEEHEATYPVKDWAQMEDGDVYAEVQYMISWADEVEPKVAYERMALIPAYILYTIALAVPLWRMRRGAFHPPLHGRVAVVVDPHRPERTETREARGASGAREGHANAPHRAQKDEVAAAKKEHEARQTLLSAPLDPKRSLPQPPSPPSANRSEASVAKRQELHPPECFYCFRTIDMDARECPYCGAYQY